MEAKRNSTTLRQLLKMRRSVKRLRKIDFRLKKTPVGFAGSEKPKNAVLHWPESPAAAAREYTMERRGSWVKSSPRLPASGSYG
jgi:hypothetical protein